MAIRAANLTLEISRSIFSQDTPSNPIALSTGCMTDAKHAATKIEFRKGLVFSAAATALCFHKIKERETRFELATFALEGRHSATELLPHLKLKLFSVTNVNVHRSSHKEHHTFASRARYVQCSVHCELLEPVKDLCSSGRDDENQGRQDRFRRITGILIVACIRGTTCEFHPAVPLYAL